MPTAELEAAMSRNAIAGSVRGGKISVFWMSRSVRVRDMQR